MKKYYKEIVEVFVRKDNLSDFYTIIDNLNDYPFQEEYIEERCEAVVIQHSFLLYI